MPLKGSQVRHKYSITNCTLLLVPAVLVPAVLLAVLVPAVLARVICLSAMRLVSGPPSVPVSAVLARVMCLSAVHLASGLLCAPPPSEAHFFWHFVK